MKTLRELDELARILNAMLLPYGTVTECLSASGSTLHSGSIANVLGDDAAARLRETTTSDQESQILSASEFDRLFNDSDRSVIEWESLAAHDAAEDAVEDE